MRLCWLGKCWQDPLIKFENLSLLPMFVTLIRQKFKSVWGEQGITHNTGNVLEQGFLHSPKQVMQTELLSRESSSVHVQGMCENPTDAKGLLCLLLTTSAPPELTQCGEVSGSRCIPALLCSESCTMPGMFPAAGCQGSVLGCLEHSTRPSTCLVGMLCFWLKE